MNRLIILDSERRLFPSQSKFLKQLYLYLEEIYLKIVYEYFIIPKLKEYLKKGKVKIIAFDKITGLILKKHKINFLPITDYVNENNFEMFRKESINFIRKLPLLVPEIDVKYSGLDLWQFDEADLDCSFFLQLVANIGIVEKIIKQEKPNELIIINSSSKLGQIQKEFYGIVKVVDRTDIISDIKRKLFNLLIPVVVKNLNFLKIIKKSNYKPGKEKEIIYFSGKRGSYFAGPLIEKINKRTVIIENEGKRLEKVDYDYLSNYIDKKTKINLLQFKRRLTKYYKRLKKSNNFRFNFKYNDIRLNTVLSDLIEFQFKNNYLKSAYYIEAFNNLYQKIKPKLIVNACECPKNIKISICLSKKYGINSLLHFHGAFGKYYGYNNLKSDVVSVWGESYKKTLVKLGNKENKIKITGNPLWDHIQDFKINKNIIFDMGLEENKKIILLATTSIPFDVRDRMTYATIKTIKKLKDCQLIIKLHPEESPDFYHKLIKKYGIKAKIIEDLGLLPSLIKISEVVLISDSTVGLEALLYNKPLIDMDLTNKGYYQDYVQEGVALGVRKEEDLLPAIISILENEVVRKNLEKNRKKYVYEHAYKQDGKAAERIVDIINQITDNKMTTKPILKYTQP